MQGAAGTSTTARVVAIAAPLAVVIVATAASLVVGSNRIPFETIVATFAGDLASPEATVLRTQRAPRTLLGLVVGLALGAAGALMQGHTRNPLAEPGLFGVNAGSALGVVTLAFAFDRTSAIEGVAGALVGGFAATALVVAFAWSGRAQGTPVTMALAGSALGAILAAATTAIVLGDRQSLDVLRFWSVGSLTGRPGEATPLVLAIIGVGMVLAVANARGVTALGLGTDVARSLGNRVAGIRIVGILSITLLSAAATAACGPIAFLGLVAPTLMRRLTGPSYGWLVPSAALAGAGILVLSDVLGRIALPSGELPVGFVLAVVGAPVLIAVVSGRRTVRL